MRPERHGGSLKAWGRGVGTSWDVVRERSEGSRSAAPAAVGPFRVRVQTGRRSVLACGHYRRYRTHTTWKFGLFAPHLSSLQKWL